ncbi:MAG TPA: DUF4340 domain-containing protein [Patescibacteria group bacterium]|nr:DUF4340 domain-containing protein [Patescibacteria group bacterium]
MKPKTLLIILGVIVVLFGFIMIDNLVEERRKNQFEDQTAFVDFFKALEAQRIEIAFDGMTTVLSREKDGWILNGNVEYAADVEVVEQIFSVLIAIQKTDVVSRNPENHSRYSVDSAKGIFVKLTNNKGENIAVFWIGDSASTGGDYLRPEGSDEVWITKPSLRTFVRKDVNEFRDHRIVRVPVDNLTAVEITSGTLGINTALQKNGDVWEVAGLANEQIDSKKVDEFLTTVATLTATDFVSGNDAKPLGLDPGILQLRLSYKDQEKSDVYETIVFGNVEELNVFVKKASSQQVYLVSHAFFGENIALKTSDFALGR